jgi:NitT/TauT family transport system substrate-binding protein
MTRRPAFSRCRARLVFLAALPAAGLVAACGSSTSSPGGATQSVTVAITPVVATADFYVAQSDGYFAKNHLSVTVRPLNGGASIVPALEGGAVQIGQSNVLSVIEGASHGINEPCFAGGASNVSLILMAGPKSGVTSLSQLAGKTVAVNATSGVNQLITEAYLAAQHVNPTSVHFIAVPYPDMPSALSSNRVAAELTSPPFSVISASQGAKVLASNPEQAVSGSTTFSCWQASASWLSSHKTVAADFATAIREADAWSSSHPAQFRTFLQHQLKISSAIASAMPMPVWTSEISAKDTKEWETLAKDYSIPAGAPPASDVVMPVGS